MKTVQLNEITPHLLTQENEPLAIEDEGHLLGYFYPVSHQQQPENFKQNWEKLDQLINQAAIESKLDPDTLIDVLDPSKPFPFESQKIAS